MDWLKDAVLYQILIDRFAGFSETHGWDQPEYLGGTLRGIINQLSYLDELGVNAVWISPHYQSSAYHGYHVTDFFSVDPHFGSLDDFCELVEAVHALDMRLIVDFVPNHISRQHRFFQDAISDRDSVYRKWFYFDQWPDTYLSFLSVDEIPKLNLDLSEVRNYILEVARFWLSMGVDGMRLDHVIGPSHDFWQFFVAQIKHAFPSVVLLGEAWMMGIRWRELRTVLMRHKRWRWLWRNRYEGLLRSYVGVLDGVLDFGVQHQFRHFFSKTGCDETGFVEWVVRHYQRFPSEYVLPGFLDNHDMDRFLFHCGNNVDCLKRAAIQLFRLPQPVIVYYGTESGLGQPESMWDRGAYGDVMARCPMNWDTVDGELFSWFSEQIAARQRKR